MSAPGVALGLACLAALWMLFVGSLQWQELVMGGLAVGGAGLFLAMVRRVNPQHVDFRWEDVRQGWRVPGYVVRDTVVVVKVLLLDVLRLRAAGSHYRVSGFGTAKRDERKVARRVLVTAYTSMSPNSIVIGVDPETSRMLQHQLQRAPSTAMEHALGARS